MAKFTLKLKEIITETHDVKTFRFDLGSIELNFLPGHFLMTNNMIDGKLIRRAYSISSSPLEKRHIDLTIKKVDNGIFSNYMHDKIKIGESLDMDGPYGKFAYKDSDDDVVLICAGCGIAPLMSIARYVLEKGLNVDVAVLHSCKTPRDIVFKDELTKMHEENKNFKYMVTVTRPQGFEWSGCTGRINAEILNGMIKNRDKTLFFVSGPVAFGNDIVDMLRKIGINEENINEEVF